jgi:hypothetical protein
MDVGYNDHFGYTAQFPRTLIIGALPAPSTLPIGTTLHSCSFVSSEML